MAHPSPNRPSAIEGLNAQSQARHLLIDDFILDAAPLVGEGGSDDLGGDYNRHKRFRGTHPSRSILGHFWGTVVTKSAFQPEVSIRDGSVIFIYTSI